jgi:hypothetical protein
VVFDKGFDEEETWDDVMEDFEDPWMREPAPLSALQEMLELEAAAMYGGGGGGAVGQATASSSVPPAAAPASELEGPLPASFEPLGLAELRRLQQEQGEALVLLDVRPATDFAAG